MTAGATRNRAWIRARTALIALVLASLAWVLAESQTLRTQSVVVQVAVLAPEVSPDALGGAPVVRVSAGQGWNGSVEVELLGSSVRTAQLADRLRTPVTLLLGRELAGLEPGRHTVDLREALRASDVFRDAGVTVDSVSPTTLDLEVDELVVVDAPVRVISRGAEAGVELDGPASAVPGSVMLTVPRSAVVDRAAARDLEIQVVAELEPQQLQSLAPGREAVLPGVPVRLPAALADGAWSVRVEPPTVEVRVRIRGRLERLVVDRVPVEVRVSPAELGRWSVEIPPADRDLVAVTLIGPAAAIERVRSGEVRPVAVLALSFEQLELGVESATAVVMGLPAGVRAEPANAEIRLRIQAVEAALEVEGQP